MRGLSGVELERALTNDRGNADVKSVAQIVKFLVSGDTDLGADDLESVSDALRAFVRACDSEDPVGRLSADALLRHDVFD